MTSIRERVRRLIGGRRAEGGAPDPAYAYTLYWTKRVQAWDAESIRRARRAVEAVLGRETFVPNEYRRAYRLPQVDDGAYAGLSLIALQKVLQAYELERRQEEQPSHERREHGRGT